MWAVNIDWDVDDKSVLEDLPKELKLPEGMVDEDEISDWISEQIGFCHKGFFLDD